jgi:quinol monooxygenase YgiN
MAAPTLPDIDGFSLHVTVFVAPENVDKLLAAFKPVFELVSAEEECIFFELYQDPASPGTLSWVENWYT